MDTFFNNLPGILAEAAKSYLGIIPLLSIALSVIAFLFF